MSSKITALALVAGLSLAAVGAGTGCSRRHIGGEKYGVSVKLAAERQAAFPGTFVAERPSGLEPGDTNIVLDNYYATIKSMKQNTATQSQVGNALTGAGVGGQGIQGAGQQ
jgi:hypothetical protein